MSVSLLASRDTGSATSPTMTVLDASCAAACGATCGSAGIEATARVAPAALRTPRRVYPEAAGATEVGISLCSLCMGRLLRSHRTSEDRRDARCRAASLYRGKRRCQRWVRG